jgi:Na+-translocating ferredoxin:NAD+ oxidoreductase RnfG subunit
MKLVVILISSILVCFGMAGNAGELISLKDYLKKELSSSSKVSKEVFQLNPEHRVVLKSLAANSEESAFSFFYGKSSVGALDKACTVVPQQGKEGPMTIGICFEPSGLVASVTILTSEEERGKKVAEESFLKQFRGKKISDAFQVGSDVDGVSGATWSSKAVAEAIRKSSFAFKTFVEVKK